MGNPASYVIFQQALPGSSQTIYSTAQIYWPMSLLIVKNISREGPGILKSVLDENDIHYDIIDLQREDMLPDILNYDAVIALGGPDSANDTTEKIVSEISMIKEVIGMNMPYFGICLGMQLLTKACGGSVFANGVKEIGFRGQNNEFYSIDILDGYENDPLFKGLEKHFPIFHLHGETVKITENMSLLATGKYCRHQIIKTGNNAYGIQGHLELTPEMFRSWLNKDPDLMEMNREDLLKDFDLARREYSSNGRKIFTNFLCIAGIL